jgi:hypothetical protein
MYLAWCPIFHRKVAGFAAFPLRQELGGTGKYCKRVRENANAPAEQCPLDPPIVDGGDIQSDQAKIDHNKDYKVSIEIPQRSNPSFGVFDLFALILGARECR